MRVAAHRRLVNADFPTTRSHQRHEFVSDNRKQGVGERITVGIALVGYEPAAQRVGPRNTRLECRWGFGFSRSDQRAGQALEPLEVPHHAQAPRRAQLAHHLVAPALVVCRRTEAARWRRLQFDPFQETIEGQVEIEPGLFAIGDDVEAGLELVVNRDGDGVINQFLAVSLAEPLEVLAGQFQPAWKRVAADHCRA